MRAVLQRVSSASVTIAGEPAPIGVIGPGLVILLGIAPTDTDAAARWLAEKICALRIFPDTAGKMNLSVREVTASEPVGAALRRDSASVSQPSTLNPQPPPSAAPGILVISQFTLFADTRKGTRPSFNDAAKPDVAIPLYEAFVRHATAALGRPVATGRFGANMSVALVNDGPVTLIVDSR